jgi:raffinose/stachyose/melibiose transport system permease protein
MKMKQRFNPLNFLKYASLLIASFIVIFPPYVIIINAFKQSSEFGAKGSGPFTLPASFFNFDNFLTVIERSRLDQAFLNTLIIIIASLIGNVVLGTMVAYALGRFDFRFKRTVMDAFLVATIIPTITTQVAVFSIIQGLGIFNTLAAPIILYIGADVVQIYIYLQFIRNIPYELDESAMMDGASLFKIYRSFIFPLLGPATATLVILKTISIYNDMYVPFLYMPKSSLGVVSTSLMRFVGINQAQWNSISAAILLILIPTVVMYLLLQKYIFSGVTSGSVKS